MTSVVLPAPFNNWHPPDEFHATWPKIPKVAKSPQKLNSSWPKMPKMNQIPPQSPFAPESPFGPEGRKRYSMYKDHYYAVSLHFGAKIQISKLLIFQPNVVMACIPKVERLCKKVHRAVKVIRDVQRCFEVSFSKFLSICKFCETVAKPSKS